MLFSNSEGRLAGWVQAVESDGVQACVLRERGRARQTKRMKLMADGRLSEIEKKIENAGDKMDTRKSDIRSANLSCRGSGAGLGPWEGLSCFPTRKERSTGNAG